MKDDPKKKSRSSWIEFLRNRNPLPIIGFLVPIAHLLSIRGLDRGILFVFIFPALVATWNLNGSSNRRAILASYSFLLLMTIGVVISKYPQLFPNLGGVDPSLPPHHDRALSWYATFFVIYIFNVVPIVWSTDNFRRHKICEPTELRRFTCWLMLCSQIVFLPAMVGLLYTEMGLWPMF